MKTKTLVLEKEEFEPIEEFFVQAEKEAEQIILKESLPVAPIVKPKKNYGEIIGTIIMWILCLSLPLSCIGGLVYIGIDNNRIEEKQHKFHLQRNLHCNTKCKKTNESVVFGRYKTMGCHDDVCEYICECFDLNNKENTIKF